MSGSLGLIAIIGAALLAVALLYAMLRNRRTPAQEARTEQATHDLYQREDRAAKRDGL